MNTSGLFVTGTDTGVGKTYVAALIATELRRAGCRVGVYKPAASGCRRIGGQLICDDAVALWEAAGRPEALEAVCPQAFEAPLAPPLAAAAEGRQIDQRLLLDGFEFWRQRSDVVIVEGAGGLFCPFGDDLYAADLAHRFGLPLVVVAENILGTVNHTLQTLIAAATYRPGVRQWREVFVRRCRDADAGLPTGPSFKRTASQTAEEQPPDVSTSESNPVESPESSREAGLSVAGVVLNDAQPPSADDPSTATNCKQIEQHIGRSVLAHVAYGGGFDRSVDWLYYSRPCAERRQ